MSRKTIALTLALALGAFALAEAQEYTCSTNPGGIDCRANIPDANAGTPGVLTSRLIVPAGICSAAVPLGHLSLAVAVKHNYVGDLQMRLIAPDGTAVTLFSPDANRYGQDVNAVFDAFGATPTFDASHVPSLTGIVYAPFEPIQGMTSASGVWQLEATDVTNTGYGALDDWTLGVVCGAVQTPIVTIVATDPIASEIPLTTGMFTITRSFATMTPLVVTFTISGTAVNGSDYVTIPVTATIPANQTSVTVTVTPLVSVAAETPETVVLTITDGAGYDVGTAGDATVTIYENEAQANVIPALDPRGLVVLVLLIGLLGVFIARRGF